MSGPIFVCDAQGQPLMPMAAAYARKLLQRCQASFLPHHAFTIIRLSHTFGAPALRPVILSVLLKRNTAELSLLAEGMKKAIPLLHVVVFPRLDASQYLMKRGVRWRRIRQRSYMMHRKTRLVRSFNDPASSYRHDVKVVERAITELRALVPISHVVMGNPTKSSDPGDASLPLTAGYKRHLMWMENRIATSLKYRGLQVSRSGSGTPAGDMPSLNATLAAFNLEPMAYASRFVAVPVARLQMNASLAIPSGTLCKTRFAKQNIVGIVSGANSDSDLILDVPSFTGSGCIVWQPLVKPISEVQVLYAARVAFLRVVGGWPASPLSGACDD
jgi:hypothetical protein